VGLVLGQPDRSWVPETAGSYRFPDASVRILSVSDGPIQNSTPILGITTIGGVSGLYGPDPNGVLRLRGTLPGPIEALVGDPVSGEVIEDPQVSPCRELVFALRDATSFSVADVCTRDAATTAVLWRDEVTQWTVGLDPPAPVDGAPQLTDLNADGHLDVLLGAGGIAYVAYGDGHGLRTAVPYRLPPADPTKAPSTIPMPLAAGDFTGDLAVDFVFRDRLLVSVPASGGAGVQYVPSHPNEGAPWTVARIADLNDNGKPDVIVASSGGLGVDFFNGTGTETLHAFRIPTSGPVNQLEVMDLDGDLIDDLVLVQAGASESDRDSLMVAFGNPAGPPGAPTLAARIGHIDQLCASNAAVGDILIVAYTDADLETGDQTAILAFLAGSEDRLPFAPYALVDVSEGSVFDEAAVALTAGKFTSGGSGDVMALGLSGNFPDLHYSFWLLPGLGTAPSAPRRLGGQIDSRLEPVHVEDLLIVNVNVTAAAADLDRDGLDEAVWVIPADGGTRCGVLVVGANGGPGAGVVARGMVILDEPCPAPQVVPVDADGDGAVDLALLTEGPGSPDRKLLVLWNDGSGGFSSANVAPVSAPGDSPEQFTVVPSTLNRPFGFAYVTDGATVWVPWAGPLTPRAFGSPSTLASLRHGSGIVAADVNGDGVLDLAVAASGDLDILMGGLASP
jgi:hypothetical protein